MLTFVVTPNEEAFCCDKKNNSESSLELVLSAIYVLDSIYRGTTKVETRPSIKRDIKISTKVKPAFNFLSN